MDLKYFMLDGDKVTSTNDIHEWGKWMQTNNRQIGHDAINGVKISTVFLGLDHSFMDEGPPVLFETMLFGEGANNEQWRYSSREMAEEGHAKIKERLEQFFAGQVEGISM